MNVNLLCAILSVATLVIFETAEKIPVFVARKGTHMTIGVLLLQVNQAVWLRAFVCMLGFLTLWKTWFHRPFRYAKPRDPGVTVFVVVACIWACLRLDYRHLAPMFFADPSAAIVGRSLRSPKWLRDKTIAGSLAAFAVTAVALAEAATGQLDNFFATLPAVLYAAATGTLRMS
eukprot:Polyplicarium_translucidae@DN1217_c0_g1_i3.p1